MREGVRFHLRKANLNPQVITIRDGTNKKSDQNQLKIYFCKLRELDQYSHTSPQLDPKAPLGNTWIDSNRSPCRSRKGSLSAATGCSAGSRSSSPSGPTPPPARRSTSSSYPPSSWRYPCCPACPSGPVSSSFVDFFFFFFLLASYAMPFFSF